MNLIFQAILITVILAAVQSLQPLKRPITNSRGANVREEINQLLTRLKFTGRREYNNNHRNAKRGMFKHKRIRSLRDNNKPNTTDEKIIEDQAYIAETELKSALTKKKSSVNERPFVEKKGRNDFLVMSSDLVDPFVTVVPNSIYYNIEKKCVNWLDDCSLKGIRARLLQGVDGPYI